MKPHFSIAVFSLFMLSAIVCSTQSYLRAERIIQADMTQALQLTIAQKQEQWITPDTIRNYRAHLRIASLRPCSFVGYDMSYRGLSSKAVVRNRNGKRTVYRSYADCSPLTVLGISDQRRSMVLWVLAFGWGVFSLAYNRRRQVLQPQMVHVGSLSYDDATHLFLDAQRKPVKLTPMQQQLMQLFFEAKGNCLSKQEICERLWPKKPDASETLYTLIRRLKPVVEQNSNLQIVSDRGKSYQLTVREPAE